MLGGGGKVVNQGGDQREEVRGFYKKKKMEKKKKGQGTRPHMWGSKGARRRCPNYRNKALGREGFWSGKRTGLAQKTK